MDVAIEPSLRDGLHERAGLRQRNPVVRHAFCYDFVNELWGETHHEEGDSGAIVSGTQSADSAGIGARATGIADIGTYHRKVPLSDRSMYMHLVISEVGILAHNNDGNKAQVIQNSHASISHMYTMLRKSSNQYKTRLSR